MGWGRLHCRRPNHTTKTIACECVYCMGKCRDTVGGVARGINRSYSLTLCTSIHIFIYHHYEYIVSKTSPISIPFHPPLLSFSTVSMSQKVATINPSFSDGDERRKTSAAKGRSCKGKEQSTGRTEAT